MVFDGLLEGLFVRRYKRFFAEVTLPSGETIVAHCPNTGSLSGCLEPGAPALVQPANNPSRKLAYTWKAINLGRGWVGIDTSIAPALVVEALHLLPTFAGFDRTLFEVPYGHEGSRIDILLSNGGTPPPRGERLHMGDQRMYVEVKNTTFARVEDGNSIARFPDAVTLRGQKHMRELTEMVKQGHRAAVVFVAQRDDCSAFEPAAEIDPQYAYELRRAHKAGVEVHALCGHVSAREIRLTRRLELRLTAPAS